MIKFTDTLYFGPWKQTPTTHKGFFTTWKKPGYEDDCILLEATRIGSDYVKWEPWFISYHKNYEVMQKLQNLYHELNPNLIFEATDVVNAKIHIDNFLIKLSNMKVFL